jgi:hypothetical protein
MSTKSLFLTAFNDEFDRFVKSIIDQFPNDPDLLATKTVFNLMRKRNPKLIIVAWQNYVYTRYAKEIAEGNIRFFIDKDYESDLAENPESDKIMEAINRLRAPLKGVCEEFIQKVTIHLQTLNSLCLKYFF